jgi:hypothetical protein
MAVQSQLMHSFAIIGRKATELGLDMQPHSQPLFDFAEIMPFVSELHDALGIGSPGRIQMLGRIVHGTAVGPSPRATAMSYLMASR